jgi:AraC-like DNA-binding protein/quercetin dioxygenase-like cupin family protein
MKAGTVPAFFSAQVADARRFYLDLKPAQNRRLTVVCGGLEHCSPDYLIHRHTFPFYSIEYVIRGNGDLKLKEHSHVLQPGRLFSYGPGVPHEIIGSSTDLLVKYFVDFAGTHAAEVLRSCNLASGRVAQVFPPNSLSPLFDELIEAGLHRGSGNMELCVSLLECLALKIVGVTAPLASLETLAFSTYQKCREYVEQNFLDLRSLEQIAKECHINKAYLCRLFRRYDHQSPYRYLLCLKMKYAAERLQQPGILVKQVAELVGFEDQFNFSRVFRNILGVSPATFRDLR